MTFLETWFACMYAIGFLLSCVRLPDVRMGVILVPWALAALVLTLVVRRKKKVQQ